MDVIFKEGRLYHQVVKFGKRTWRNVWMVLFKASSTGVGRVELSAGLNSNGATDQKKICRLKTPERKVVRLSDCLSVIAAPKESCPSGCTAFYLHTMQCTYTLASTTSQDWLSALRLLAFQNDPGESDKGAFERGNGLTMEDNDLYSSWKTDLALPPNQYQVTVQSTEASRRCRLAGKYLLSPEKEAVTLLDVSTGRVFYRWPYRLLRRFGQVEGGFSIEAGRRCESGEGVFVFLSRHGPQIFQAISEQCSVDRTSTAQPVALHRRSLCDLSPVILPTTTSWPDVSAAEHYSTINHTPVLLPSPEPHVTPPQEYEDECCGSLEAVNLDVMEDNIYCNLQRAALPVMRYDEVKPEAECIYSAVKKVDSPLNPHLQPPLPPVVPQPPPQSLPSPQPKLRCQPPADNYIQPGYNTRAQAVDDAKEMEEAVGSSPHVPPTEDAGSFKQKLAEIISKNLAKSQPPLPSGSGSPTFSQ